MALRRNTRKTSQRGSGSKGGKLIVIFWLVFVVVIISIALFKWPTITRNFDIFITRLNTAPGTEEETVIEETVERPAEQPTPIVTVTETPRRTTETEQTITPQTTTPQATQTQDIKPQTQTTQQPVPPPAPQMRDRTVYFAQVNKDGQILQSRATRRLPVSDTPMLDALNVMLAGPSAEELTKGVLNLIPENTRILSAAVRGSTAYISFSEDFMFNTFGVEGYVAQLRQIVWTVTEFQNVRDVQILIEGRRLDYLGEGIWIGSPIGRQSF